MVQKEEKRQRGEEKEKIKKSDPFKKSTNVGRLPEKQKGGWDVIIRKIREMREKFKELVKEIYKLKEDKDRTRNQMEEIKKGVGEGEEKIKRKYREVGEKIVRK